MPEGQVDTKQVARLHQPLPIPYRVWKNLSMDFIEDLPMSGGYQVIWVVVDWVIKVCSFYSPTPPIHG